MNPNILLILVVILIVAYFAGYEKLFYITVGAVAVSAVGEIKVSGGAISDNEWILMELQYDDRQKYNKEDVDEYFTAMKKFFEFDKDIPYYNAAEHFTRTKEGAKLYYKLTEKGRLGREVPPVEVFTSTPWDDLELAWAWGERKSHYKRLHQYAYDTMVKSAYKV
jgi:hypothetical protein